MKNKYIIFYILTIVIVLISSFLFFNRNRFSKGIFDTIFKFNSPYLVESDNENNLYLLDNRSKRISKIDINGKIDFVIEGGKRNKEDIYLVLDMKVHNNYLYVVNVIVDLVDGYAGIYEIKRYNNKGKYDKTLFRYIRSKEERLSREGEIIAGTLQIVDDYIYYVFYKKDSGSVLYKQNINTGEKIAVISIPEKLTAISMSGIEPGNIYLSKLNGKIYQIDKNGKLREFFYISPFSLKAPWGINFDKEGNIYVSDIKSQGIYKISKTKKLEELTSFEKIKKEGYVVDNVILRYFSINPKNGILYIVDEYNDSILGFSKDGKLENIVFSARMPGIFVFFNILLWLLLITDIILIILTLWYFYQNIINKRISLIVKMIFTLIPIVIVSIIVISFRIYGDLYKRQAESLYNNVAMIAQIASEKIDGNALERINEPKDFMGADYNKILNQMHAIMNDNADPWNALPYSRIYRVFNNLFYITCDWSSRYGVFYPYPYATDVHKNAYYKGQIGYTRYTDFDSDLIVGVAPIKNKLGKIVGVYEVIIDGYVMDEVNTIFKRQLYQGLTVSIIIFLAISVGFILLLMMSLRKLRDAIKSISSGKWDTTINITSHDEVGDLGEGFNIMAGYIRNYINEITELNKVYFKFVPNEFLKFLGKSNITDLRLGDQVQKDMTILFSDIRSFTSLSETMSPEDNFNFINAYLRRVGPLIRKNRGFIDKYIGDAIMALFPENVEDGLIAGIEMRQKLYDYNEKRKKTGYVPIDIGVGINCGKIMLGIIGEEERMDGTVISDSVNLASRLEGLTKHYGAGIIISENVMNEISNFDNKYSYRFLDKVKVKGKTKPISIYEVLDGCMDEEKDKKIKTKDDFLKAIELYYNKKLEEALKIFNKILKANTEDKAITLYIKRCENYLKYGLPEGWEGVESITEK
ncbi:MAG: HAMP domain-containing protein [Brevinematales bacterium]|nr:HAMP domain-containing protein [Brevinematales bacterium]